jgi:hypothetical protein
LAAPDDRATGDAGYSDMDFTIVTLSYPPDFERCRLLCDTVDRFVAGDYRHVIVVDYDDLKLFSSLRSSRRNVLEKEALFPPWIRPTRLRVGKFRRRMWFSLKGIPINGWLAQQISKIAIARRSDSDIVVFADSDICFVRPFGLANITKDTKVRLERIPAAVTMDKKSHRVWCETARRLLAVPPITYPAPDYISQLVTWRRANAESMCQAIERTTGRHWIISIGNARRFSEYMAYGIFVEHVAGDRAMHYFDPSPLCHTYWDYAPLNAQTLRRFFGAIGQNQVAIGIQSVSQTPLALVRDCLASLP